ncbi:MAG TPA: hypothetical protein VFJ64_10765 [Solirubrobacterales bacterium]|nr:hypothetical protein [Solirubrobacterales bacterium]
MKDALIIGAAALGVYAVWRWSKSTAPAAPTPPPSAPGFWEQTVAGAEATIQRTTGVPVASIGSAAQKAPTWLKVAVFPVGVTSVAQGVITHPVDTAKSVGRKLSSAYHAVGSLF